MELFKILGTIAIDNTKAKDTLKDTTTEAKKTSSETEKAFQKIGNVAKNVALGIGAAGLAIGGAFIGVVESTREYRKEMGLLEAAYLTAGHSSETAKNTYSELNAVLGDTGQAVEASQHLAKLTDNEKDLQTWTDICTGVYATFGASLPIEGLTEAANETAKVGQVTGPLADALNWAGISEDKFNEKLAKCTNEQERQKLIMDTLNNTYKDASTQYKETNKDVMEANKAQERLSNAFADVGAVCEPIMTSIKNAIADMAEKAVPVIENLIQKFKDISTWVKENEDTIHKWVAVILGATVAIGTFLLILNWSSIMTAAANAIKVVRTAILAMNAAMLANPIGLIVALIAGLVTAFIYLWNNVEGFRKFWIEAWKKIQSAASDAWKWISKTYANIGKWFKEKFEQVQKSGKDAMNKVKKWFLDAWSGIKNAWSSVKSFFSGIWSGIKLTFNSVKSWFTNIFKGAWNGVKSVWNGAKSFFSGIWSSIRGTFGSVSSWFGSKFRSAWTAIKNAFSGFGSFFSGLWGKVKDKFGSIGAKIGSSMSSAVTGAMNKVIGKIQSAINGGIRLINSAIRLANKLPGIDVGTVKEVSLPRLAEGGVLKKGQVGILEGSGAEAVVPLEKNTGWLDKIATRLVTLQSGHTEPGMEAKLDRMIELLEQLTTSRMYLDTGVLVAELSPMVDEQFGRISTKRIRRNI